MSSSLDTDACKEASEWRGLSRAVESVSVDVQERRFPFRKAEHQKAAGVGGTTLYTSLRPGLVPMPAGWQSKPSSLGAGEMCGGEQIGGAILPPRTNREAANRRQFNGGTDKFTMFHSRCHSLCSKSQDGTRGSRECTSGQRVASSFKADARFATSSTEPRVQLT